MKLKAEERAYGHKDIDEMYGNEERHARRLSHEALGHSGWPTGQILLTFHTTFWCVVAH